MSSYLIQVSRFICALLKFLFSNLKNESCGFVPMANEKRCEIIDVGDISHNFNDGYKLILKNVFALRLS